MHTAIAKRAAIIGAGLSGAGTAYQLALRGWRVDVFERGSAPASGASGLPVGIFCPKPSADDTLLSQLVRAGLDAALEDFRALLHEGIDWRPTGVLEGHNSDTLLTAYAQQLQTKPLLAHYTTLSQAMQGFLHHHAAGWVKPAALVNAWLAHPNIVLLTNSAVEDIQILQENHGAYDAVVLCSSTHSKALSQLSSDNALPFLRPIRGQITLGQQADWSGEYSAIPTNGHGHLINNVPLSLDGRGTQAAWTMGATFERNVDTPHINEGDNLRNLEKLALMLPAAKIAIAPILAEQRHSSWAGIRCYTPDRFPIVGHLEGNVFILTGLGSRGLSMVGLCARVLAQKIDTGVFSAPQGVNMTPQLLSKINVARYTERV